jgi:integrase
MRTIRVDRVIPGVGRITARCPDRKTKRTWDGLVTTLYDTGRLEILRQLKAGSLTFREVLNAERTGKLTYVAESVTLSRPLWASVGLDKTTGNSTGDGWLATAAPAPATRTRYAGAWRALWKMDVVGADATVNDLAMIDWHALAIRWPAGPTSWGHTRAAVSAFLTRTLRSKLHPFRVAIMDRYPRKELPPGRTPDLSPERFWEILRHVPEPLRACYVAMVSGGLGPGEYLRAEAHHLMPLTRGLRVIGTKQGRQGEHTVTFDEQAWAWVEKAIPCPVGYWTLRDAWKRACTVVGQQDDRLYDLRHCAGQWLADGGVSEARIQGHLRHKTASMTRRYTRSVDRGQAAEIMGSTLFKGSQIPEAEAANS